MRYKITHKTGYNYSAPASLSQNELFLRPRSTAFQNAAESIIAIKPDPQYRHRRTDYFGNTVDVFMVQHPHTTLEVTATSIVETSPPAIPPPESTMTWEEVVRRLTFRSQHADLEASQFIFASPMVALSAGTLSYAMPSFPSGKPILAGAADLMNRIFTEYLYDKSASTVDTPVEIVLENRKGVCQDFAHLAISCLRSLGLAARYVSGYLETIPPPGKQKVFGADASHAWVSIYIPDTGWVDFDPTNNQMANERYITLAWGRDYADVAPVKGVVMGGGTHRLSVTVDVSAQNTG
jgi:transglutaminase-like putative cysteine protease